MPLQNNQGYRRDLDLAETENDSLALSNLGGTGVGYSVQRHHVDKLPEIRKPIKSRRYLIQDSIEGWADAVMGNSNYRFTNQEILHNVEILDTIVRSIGTGKMEEVK